MTEVHTHMVSDNDEHQRKAQTAYFAVSVRSPNENHFQACMPNPDINNKYIWLPTY